MEESNVIPLIVVHIILHVKAVLDCRAFSQSRFFSSHSCKHCCHSRSQVISMSCPSRNAIFQGVNAQIYTTNPFKRSLKCMQTESSICVDHLNIIEPLKKTLKNQICSRYPPPISLRNFLKISMKNERFLNKFDGFHS
ncbi:hypothetical protein NPIL_91151 [Nephila pilipes]|uniref:Uncharacterized protein n=1 Tax=Nephila pilipes TaxID=299642 RepID=A0A8X6U9K6_NEPPI|nr:hypothetical protein NPIL_91151 [Nephila pilipes]